MDWGLVGRASKGGQVRRALWVCLALGLVPFLALAGDVWKDKPYGEWSAKDVKKILSGSPWAKEILIAYYPQTGGAMTESTTRVATGNYDPMRDPARDPLAKPDAQTATFQPKDIYTLRWASSRTVRRALFRQSSLRGGTAGPGDLKRLEQNTKEFELTLSSDSNLTRWPEVGTSEWAAKAYLMAKSSGRKVAPSHVEERRGIQISDGPSMIFFFPKKLPNGEPLIGLGETVVEFFAQVGPRIFLAKFNPTLMVAKDGLDW